MQHVPTDPKAKENGTFSAWALKRGIVKRMIVPEIPGKLTFSQRQLVVDMFFEFLLDSKCDFGF